MSVILALTQHNKKGGIWNIQMTVEMFLSCDFCWHNFISCVTTGISVFMEYTTLLTKFFTWYILSVLTLIPCTSWEKMVLLVRSENTSITVKMYYNTDGSFWVQICISEWQNWCCLKGVNGELFAVGKYV